MFIIKDNSLMMAVSRGDSAFFTINFSGDIPEDGTIALFTIRNDDNNGNGREMIKKYIPISDGAVNIELYSHDTNKLDPGNYLWDIRIIFSENEVVTPMVPSTFVVLEVAGDV